MNENFAVFLLMLTMVMLAALVTGFTCGFGGFLLYVTGLSLVTLLYRRFVVCRPRYVACGAFVGVYQGDRYYLLEVA